MEDVDKKQLQEIMGKTTCPKDFICYKTELQDLCKAEDVGMKSFLKCLEENPTECAFSLGYGGSYYCKCPVRLCIAKTLGK